MQVTEGKGLQHSHQPQAFCLALGLKVILHFGVYLLTALAEHVSWAEFSTQVYNVFQKLYVDVGGVFFLNPLENKNAL